MKRSKGGMKNKITRRDSLGLLIASSFLPLSACSGILPGQGPPETLYRLTPKSTFEEKLPEVDWQMVIERPVTNKSLDTTRIALLRDPTQVEYYARAGWIDRAPSMIQTLLIESFENSGKIISVGRENIGLRSDFVLKVENLLKIGVVAFCPQRRSGSGLGQLRIKPQCFRRPAQ